MAVINPGKAIPGSGLGVPLRKAGAPVAGATEVDTLTIGGTPTGGTFTLFQGQSQTTPITWSATNATLLANTQAALQALPNIGTSNLVATAGTLTAGIGTVTLTFAGALTVIDVTPITAGTNSLTGTTPTIAMAQATAGVHQTGKNVAPKGALLNDTTDATLYQNTGTVTAPVWTKVGAET